MLWLRILPAANEEETIPIAWTSGQLMGDVLAMILRERCEGGLPLQTRGVSPERHTVWILQNPADILYDLDHGYYSVTLWGDEVGERQIRI